jgi:hypothetical protein
MNDMLAFLHDVVGVNASLIEGMVTLTPSPDPGPDPHPHPGPGPEGMTVQCPALTVDSTSHPPSTDPSQVMMQGMLNRQQLDERFFHCRLCQLGGNTSRKVAQWLTQSSSGRMFTLPNCASHPGLSNSNSHSVTNYPQSLTCTPQPCR